MRTFVPLPLRISLHFVGPYTPLPPSLNANVIIECPPRQVIFSQCESNDRLNRPSSSLFLQSLNAPKDKTPEVNCEARIRIIMLYCGEYSD